MQHVILTSISCLTHCHTFHLSVAWFGVTRYHNLNALPHVLPYIFSEIFLVLGYLQRVTTRFHQIYKIYKLAFKKNDGNT